MRRGCSQGSGSRSLRDNLWPAHINRTKGTQGSAQRGSLISRTFLSFAEELRISGRATRENASPNPSAVTLRCCGSSESLRSGGPFELADPKPEPAEFSCSLVAGLGCIIGRLWFAGAPMHARLEVRDASPLEAFASDH